MDTPKHQINFTGEFFVPGKSGERIESDHIERYIFACDYVNGKAVLDIACGFGYAGPLVIKAGATKYEGVDINEQLIDNANSLYGTDYIKYYQGDICSYNSNKLFDIITCFETIEHVSNYRSALLNIYRLLRTNGMLIISSPNRPVTSPDARYLSDKPSNHYHVQEFTVAELKNELIAAGFSAETNNIFGQRNNFLNILNIRNKHLSKVARFLFGDPSTKSSPKVSKIYNKTPRYFIIVANK